MSDSMDILDVLPSTYALDARQERARLRRAVQRLDFIDWYGINDDERDDLIKWVRYDDVMEMLK